MTDCLIFNISVPQRHPASICVESSRLLESLSGIQVIFDPVGQEESLMEFITEFSRKEEVKPSDRTIGFVVVNLEKKKIAISLSNIPEADKNGIQNAAEKFRALGIETEVDV